MLRNRVLVIDDDPDFRELIALSLNEWGLQCIQVADCAQALPLLERERDRLRVVLCDYFMPGLSPCDCVKAIRERVDPGVCVVLVSAAVDISELAADLGLARFLAKPFDLDQLHDAVLGPRAPSA
ncbi:response regulator [Sorangium sp. So ce1014]|uniref:response regulator n=1 Tax=unclassified Sorangium TaxID=2621164 RepID=UPI003F5E03AE